MKQALNRIGFSFVILAVVLGILYNIYVVNDRIGDLFYKPGREGISHLSNLDSAHDRQTLDKNIEGQKKSYETLIEIIKRNRPEINYEVVHAIESKSIAEYASAANGDPKAAQFISPAISLLTEKGEQAEVVTNLDTLKIWYKTDEASSFLFRMLLFFLLGIVTQFFSRPS